MPREKNTVLRVVVPLIAIAAGALIVWSFVRNSARTTPLPPPTAAQERQPADSAADGQREEGADATPGPAPAPGPGGSDESDAADPATEEGEASGVEPGGPGDTGAPGAPGAPVAGPDPTTVDRGQLRARYAPPPEAGYASLGSPDPDSGYRIEVRFTPLGAGVETVTLTNHYRTVERTEHYQVQARAAAAGYTVSALAARAVDIDGRLVDLYGRAGEPLWRETGAGEFEALVVDGADEPVARIVRRYVVRPGSFDITLEQWLENLTAEPMAVQWIQYGPVDLPVDQTLYGGDKRRLHLGRLVPPERDPSRQFVEAEALERGEYLPDLAKDGPVKQIWPSSERSEGGAELTWAALTNRYFAFAVHRRLAESEVEASLRGTAIDKRLRLAQEVHVVAIGRPGGAADAGSVAVQLTGPVESVDPGGRLDLSLGAYAGPLARGTVGEEAQYTALGLDHLVIFHFGGMCAFCTFQPLARALLSLLSFFDHYLVRDWALAIMLLVVCVRGVLHPVTKKSQIAMQRFGKQMQALAPKQQKLKEKYGDDPKRLQQEMAKLMREEGVNFTGALGCLPMFLQSPVWIALYAMLFFAFDLRHEPAFYGVFQAVTGGAWHFLSDLSAPDRFIDFGGGVSVPLMGELRSLNVLPLVLGVVFYLQQKYLTPPPSAALTPEQQTQQKIMKVMFVVMFPVIMYNAPSGLAIYFITNSVLGIAESRYIRSHIDQADLELKKPRPGDGAGAGAVSGGRKRVRNEAPANPFAKKRERGPGFKQRKKK